MRFRDLLCVCLLAVGVMVGVSSPATAAVPGGPVSTTPANWTPHFPSSTSPVSRVRQLVECGTTMYAVGTFATIIQGTTTYTRDNAFSFNASTGAVTSWNPNVNGTVNSIALSANCSTAYIGGTFSSVNGTAVTNLASVSTSTALVNTGFAHNANKQVEALFVTGNHVLVGGYFTSANGSTKHYMLSVNPSTGLDDGYVNLNITGHYVYTDDGGNPASGNGSRVYNFALSPDGTRLLVMGDFTSVAGTGPPTNLHARPRRVERHPGCLVLARIQRLLRDSRTVLRAGGRLVT